MVTVLLRWLPLAAGLLLAGCTFTRFDLPAPAPPASSNTAVLSLLDQAGAQTAAGQWPAAGASLERALRIEPRNPALWQQLARIRFEEGKYQQAENLAAKSNALAGDNKYLCAENWRLIGEARSQRGDQKGAQAALERAEQGFRSRQ